MDFSLVQTPGATKSSPAPQLQQQSGRDEHSIVADEQFVDPALGDYRVKDGSPTLCQICVIYCDEIIVPSFHGLAVAVARVGGARHGRYADGLTT
jgi:hypothetical protein